MFKHKATLDTIKHKKEKSFYLFMQTHGIELQYEPMCFKVRLKSVVRRYTPDFYDPKTNTFYELVGSYGTFTKNKYKIARFRTQYPQFNFKIISSVRKANFVEIRSCRIMSYQSFNTPSSWKPYKNYIDVIKNNSKVPKNGDDK